MIGFELVHIKWIDSEVLGEWTEIKELSNEFSELHSFGLLLDSGAQGYVLAGMYDPENHSANAIQFIPKACVIKITPLTMFKGQSK